MKKLWLLMVLVVLSAGACSVGLDADLDGQASALNINTDMVQLMSSEMSNGGWTGGYYETYLVLSGEIKVKNVAYDKTVMVHMSSIGSPVGIEANGTWYDVAASYARPADEAGYEIWEFQVVTKLYKGGQGSTQLFTYAVSYAVNGQTYWDNNGGLDYINGVPACGMVGLATAEYGTTSHPSLYTMNHILQGEILVKNTAYNKAVTVRYIGSDNQWHDIAARYLKPSYTYGNYEVWAFSITTAIYKYPPSNLYQFAIKYVVDGAEYWDNNGGANYNGMSF